MFFSSKPLFCPNLFFKINDSLQIVLVTDSYLVIIFLILSMEGHKNGQHIILCSTHLLDDLD